MKRYVLISVLIAMFVSTTAFSQRPDEPGGRPEENMEREMNLRRMHLELEEREMELNFHRKMQELELDERRIALECERAAHEHAGFKHGRKGGALPFIIVCFVVHILLAVWVYKDIRQRNHDSGIWIVIVLLTGLLGVLPYAIVRLGDIRQTKS